MKVIDTFCHFLPRKYLRFVTENMANDSYMFAQISKIPTIYSLANRLDQVLSVPDYRQILSLVGPASENLVDSSKVCHAIRLSNSGLAKLVNDHPNAFAGFVANVSLMDANSMLTVAEEAVKQLGALGVQISTNIKGRAIDSAELFELYAMADELDFPIWLHPAGTQSFTEYEDEDFSRYELWWALGWPYHTTAAMARLVFSGVFDKFPNLKIITHHAGAMIPMVAGRLSTGLKNLGKRTPPHQHKMLIDSIIDDPLRHLRKFYVDTATFAWKPSIDFALTFFDIDHVLFASDSPFGPDNGNELLIQELTNVHELALNQTDKEKILSQNIIRITNGKI